MVDPRECGGQDVEYSTEGRQGHLTMADLDPAFFEKSYIGNKKDGIKTGRPAIDLKSRESNELNIHCLEHGQRESSFTTGDLKAAETTVTAVPRYFSFGADVIDIKIQMSILRSVTGKDPYLDRETAINRGSLWKGWYLNKARDSRQFVLHHLPVIASNYVHVWVLEWILADNDDVISPHLFRQVDDQIRKLIHFSNQAPVAQLRTMLCYSMITSL
jgi:hypothetical protein